MRVRRQLAQPLTFVRPPEAQLRAPLSAVLSVCNLASIKDFKTKHSQYLIEKIQPQDVKTEQPLRRLSGAVSCRRTRSL